MGSIGGSIVTASRGVRLYLKPAHGTRLAVWVIRDGSKRISTGAAEHDLALAERQLAIYLGGAAPADYRVLYNRFHQAKRRAKDAGREFELTIDFVREMGDRQRWRCALTGLKFDMTGDPWSRPFAPSIDRIENDGGYTRDNVRLVLHSMNCALGPWGEDAFAPIAKAFLDMRRAA